MGDGHPTIHGFCPAYNARLSAGTHIWFAVYSFCIECVVWFLLAPAMWLRARVNGADLIELRQRLGHLPLRDGTVPSGSSPVLVHAVSLGEMHAAAPLVQALAAEGRRVLLTTGTRAGHDAALRLARTQPSVDGVTYLPWDRRAIRGWLAGLGPSAVVIMETEIWPNLFRASADLRIPLFIANGRIRPVDVRRYRLARTFFSEVLTYATWIGVQSAEERERFLAIGAPADRVEVAGNLKFDAALAATGEPASGVSRDPRRSLVVAGSTHDPEERWLLECAALLTREGMGIQLVLAPRDVRRAGAVAQLARSQTWRTRLWSESPNDEWDVMVLDHFGTLRACYAGADIAVIGGTFAPIGGHNLLEAAASGRPILVGPYTEAIASVVELFDHAGALMRVSGAEPALAMAEQCRTLLTNRVKAQSMGDKAAELCRHGAGSAARHARVIVERSAR